MTQIDRTLMPEGLLCNGAKQPLGIEVGKPLFSWRFITNSRGKFQTAYQIVVAENLELIETEDNVLWDSGKIVSNQCSFIPYDGAPLKSATSYFWKVRCWDETDTESLFSDPAEFETALVDEDWAAKWIGSPKVEAKYQTVAPLFRKVFEIAKPIQKARVYVSGLGYYELRLNGGKVGDHVLDPGWTDYTKRVLYATYDVTSNLQEGTNVIGVIAGAGWYGIPSLKLQLQIWYEDGTEDSITTDSNGWYTSVEGPVRQNSIYHGELYDARREIVGWDTASYDPAAEENSGHQWKIPNILEGPGGKMAPQELEPIKVIGELLPIQVTEQRSGVFVYDFGQNIAGWALLRVSGQQGTEITMKFAEMIYEDGTVNTENLRSAKATDTYIVKGGSEETYEPKFTYHGFRYLQLEGFSERAEIHQVKACIVRSAVSPSGSFVCSNELINQIQKNVVWTESDNLHSVPTDCPQRDERMGWLNDLTVRSEGAIYNFNLSRFYAKYMQDIVDAQGIETGAISDTVPISRFGLKPADPVSSSFLLLPWLMYVHYGNREILVKHYDAIKKWASYLERQTQNHIVTYSYYGDWASPVTQSQAGSLGAGAVSANTPGELMSTGYHYYNTVILSTIAKILEKTEDHEQYEKLAKEIAQAFHKRFYNPEENYYASGSQGSQVFPLFLGIVPNEDKEAVLQRLVNDIMEENNGHLTTGNLCTKYIMDVLTDNSRLDVAYTLATQTTYPSWGYMIANGATTIWERWEHVTGGPLTGMASHNHPMYGAITAWFYKKLAGIQADPEGPGFAKFSVKPHVPKNMTYAKSTLQTVRGEVNAHWEQEDNNFRIKVTVPWNSEAKISIPVLNQSADKVQIIENGQVAWEKGQYNHGIEGFFSGSNQEEGYVTFTVGSGQYDFNLING